VTDIDLGADVDPLDLEAQLVALGRHLDLPTAPDLRSAVLTRLDEPRPGPTVHRRRVVRFAVATIAALLLLAAVTPAGQAAVARVVHAFGVTLRLGSPPAPGSTAPGTTAPGTAAPGTTAPGQPEQLPGETVTTLEQARRQVGFTVVVPSGLGTPDQVTVSDGGRVLSLVYRSGTGRPTAGPGGVSARLDEFDGSIEPAFLKQIVGNVEWVSLPNDEPAVWIDSPHSVTYLDRSGAERSESAHLSARTLIWSVGGVSLRLEGDFTRQAALAIAAATVPAPTATP